MGPWWQKTQIGSLQNTLLPLGINFAGVKYRTGTIHSPSCSWQAIFSINRASVAHESHKGILKSFPIHRSCLQLCLLKHG